MTVADTLQQLATDIQSAYTTLENKGADIPTNKNTNNLMSTIQSLNVGNITTEVVKQTLTAESTSISFSITSGKVPKAIELWNSNEGTTMQSGEIRRVFFITQAGSMYRNNRVNGQNAWFPCTLTGDNVSVARVTLTDTSVTINHVSNTYYLADVEYKLIAYFWEDSQKTSTITATSDMTNALQVSNFLKKYAEDNAYTIFTTTEEDVSNLPNNGMLSYTIRNENGTNVVLGGSRYRNGVQEPIPQPANNAYDCVLNNGDKVYRTVIPLDGKVYKDDSELVSLINGTITEIENKNVTSVRRSAFAYTSIKKAVFPNVTSLGRDAFSNSSLQVADIGKLTSIDQYVFDYAGNFTTLVIRSASVCTLNNTSAFRNTKFRNGTGGTVYVPRDLVSSYESATNWSSLESTTFAAIEDNIETLEALGLNVDEFKE